MLEKPIGSVLPEVEWLVKDVVMTAERTDIGILLGTEEGDLKAVYSDHEVLSSFSHLPHRPIFSPDPPELVLTGNFTSVPGTIIARFVDHAHITALILLNAEDPIAVIAVQQTSSATGMVRWIHTQPQPWEQAFTEYVNFVSFKLKGKESLMINDPSKKPTASNGDPMEQAAFAMKEMAEVMLKNGEFDLRLDLNGRTLSNGSRELSGNFTLTMPNSDK